ncbi:MAG TPA: SDR family oxidoreductase [Longimicrobium sp.]|jgi:NAD(P)-dependent dehydrogenase (short-subunit alcohol dehydrogenase family)|uniref:SDR family oxidoreductase n=1 Tax=Longimicrobium sp. TaxID=2029185 RepID=UPI002ED9EFF1
MSAGRLAGKVAVVTGGNSGIGLAAAEEFARQGAAVVITGRDQATLHDASARLRTLGADVLAETVDVTSRADLERLADRVRERFGRVDALFVNAGVAQFAPVDQASEEHFDWIFDINVRGAYFTVQKLLPLIPDGGAIVFNGSINALIGMPGSSVYAASKAAVRSLARTFSADLVERRIRVNVVSPGPVTTPLYGRLGLPPEALEAAAANIQGQVPMKRFGEPDEIAKAVLFLVTPDSSFVLGAELVADGGMTQL